MGRQHLSPENYGKHATQWPATLFEIRINNESDEERVREAVKAEGQRSNTRKWRIACCNERLAEL